MLSNFTQNFGVKLITCYWSTQVLLTFNQKLGRQENLGENTKSERSSAQSYLGFWTSRNFGKNPAQELLYASVKVWYNATYNLHMSSWDT